MPVTVITPPLVAITLDEAKKHLRVDHTDDDDLISTFIDAAQGQIDGPDGWLGRAVGVQTLEVTGIAPEPCGRSIRLLFPPLISVTSVSWTGGVLDPATYQLAGGTLTPVTAWPWDRQWSSVKVRYVAGYGKPDGSGGLAQATPAPIKAALMLMVSDLYGNRSTKMSSTLTSNLTVDRLLASYRILSL